MILSTTLLFGCSVSDRDNDLLSQPDCAPPCWHNMNPGETTKEEVLSKLHTFEMNNEGELYDSFVEISDSASWTRKDGKRFYFSFDDDHLRVIRFEVGQTRVNALLTLFGEPEAIAHELSDPHGKFTYIGLYYPSQGVMFTASGSISTSDPVRFRVSMDDEVIVAFFVEPGTLEAALEDIYGAENIERILAKLHPWIEHDSLEP